MTARCIKSYPGAHLPPSEDSVHQHTAPALPRSTPRRKDGDRGRDRRDLPAVGDSGHAHLPTADCLLHVRASGNGLTEAPRVPSSWRRTGGECPVCPRELGLGGPRPGLGLGAGSGRREPRSQRARRRLRPVEREAHQGNAPHMGGAHGEGHGPPLGRGGLGSRAVGVGDARFQPDAQGVDRVLHRRAPRGRQGQAQRHEEPRSRGPRASPCSVDFASHARRLCYRAARQAQFFGRWRRSQSERAGPLHYAWPRRATGGTPPWTSRPPSPSNPASR